MSDAITVSFACGLAVGFAIGGFFALRMSIYHWSEYMKFAKKIRDADAARIRIAESKGK